MNDKTKRDQPDLPFPPEVLKVLLPKAGRSVMSILKGEDAPAARRFLEDKQEAGDIPADWPPFNIELGEGMAGQPVLMSQDYPTAVIVASVLMSPPEDPYAMVPDSYRDVRDGIWLVSDSLAMAWENNSNHLVACFEDGQLEEIRRRYHALENRTPGKHRHCSASTLATLTVGILRMLSATGNTDDLRDYLPDLTGISKADMPDVMDMARETAWHSLLAESLMYDVTRHVVTIYSKDAPQDPPSVHFVVVLGHIDEADLDAPAIDAALEARSGMRHEALGDEAPPEMCSAAVVSEGSPYFDSAYAGHAAWQALAPADWAPSPEAAERIAEWDLELDGEQ